MPVAAKKNNCGNYMRLNGDIFLVEAITHTIINKITDQALLAKLEPKLLTEGSHMIIFRPRFPVVYPKTDDDIDAEIARLENESVSGDLTSHKCN